MIEQLMLDMLLADSARGVLTVVGCNDPFVSGQVVRVLTLTQPWATLVVIGAKRLETRSWQTHYRGPVAIHAAAGFPAKARRLCDSEPFHSTLLAALAEKKPGRFHRTDAVPQGKGWSALLPTGVILGRCNVNGCEPITEHNLPAEPERSFGIYTCPGRFAWSLDGVQEFSRPIPAKGALGLWRFPWPDLP